jgi:hypothetical protein
MWVPVLLSVPCFYECHQIFELSEFVTGCLWRKTISFVTRMLMEEDDFICYQDAYGGRRFHLLPGCLWRKMISFVTRMLQSAYHHPAVPCCRPDTLTAFDSTCHLPVPKASHVSPIPHSYNVRGSFRVGKIPGGT